MTPVILSIFVSGCDLSQIYGETGNVTPGTDGFISKSGFVASSSFQTVGDGFAVANGILDGEKYAAYSGIDPNAVVDANLTGGSATYTAAVVIYGYEELVENEDGNVYANVVSYGGTINLAADFDSGTLTAPSTSIAGTSVSNQFGSTKSTSADLSVNGNITGTGVSGSVAFNPANGTADVGILTGLVGDDRVIGAFHGKEDDFLYAGGFEGDAD
jgi:hypothetical protein